MSDKKPDAPHAFFMNFRFLRLDFSFHKLMPNEKVVARQEFLAVFDTVAEHMPVAVFAVTGLRSDADVLIWRVTRHLTDLHAMSSRLQAAGLGRYLLPTRTWTGTVTGERYAAKPKERGRSAEAEGDGVLGLARYLMVRAVRGEAPGSLPPPSAFPSAHVHVADCTGIDDPAFVTAFETEDPLDHRRYVAASPTAIEAATYTCIRASMREIIDSFG